MKNIYASLAVVVMFVSPVHSQQSVLLEKYRQMALEYNHDLKAAEKNITASMELEKSARADQKPKLSGEASFQHTGNPYALTLNLPVFDDPMKFEGRHLRYGASVSLLQPVYTGGRILESIKLAQHQQSLASYQADLFRSAVCYQTDIQYWNTVARYELVEVTTEFRNAIASLVNTIKERVEAGLLDPQDLLMAEVKLNEAEYQLLQAQNMFETGRMALNSLIGIDLNYPTEIDSNIPKVSFPKELLFSEANDRPEVNIAQEQIRISERSLKLSDSKYKPQLYVGVDGTYSSPGYDFRSDLDPNYIVYAKLSVSIFEWGKRKSEKRMSSMKTGMATDNLRKVEDNVNLEIETARTSLNQAMERVGLSESSLEKAYENERKAVERYTEGEISIIEVIDAQVYRQTSQLNYVQAKASAQANFSDLIKAKNRYDSQ